MKNSGFKKLLSVIMCVLLLTGTMPFVVIALDAVSYVDENGDTYSVTDYTIVEADADGKIALADGWNVLNSDVSATGEVSVPSGTAKLILCDGYTLTATGGVTGALTVYGQALGTGTLDSDSSSASTYGIYGNPITINSGTVKAVSAVNYSAIGGTVVINGGKVTATGAQNGAGIGGKGGTGGMNYGTTANVTINGGVVNATGGDWSPGIGNGNSTSSNSGSVVINGGTVSARGGRYGAGIGTAQEGRGMNITINGGSVTAYSGLYGDGIGNGWIVNASEMGTVDINGGTVTATGSQCGIAGAVVSLNWTNTTDSVKASGTNAAYKGATSFTIENDYVFENTKTLVTTDNINSTKICAYPGPFATVSFVDDDGATALYPSQRLAFGGMATRPTDPSGVGKVFDGWQLNGSDFDFSTAVTSDITLVAHWSPAAALTYIDENGELQSTSNYITLAASTQAQTLISGWYAVTSDITISERITVSGDVHLILCDNFTLTAPKGITVNSGNSLSIYSQTNSAGVLLCNNVASGNAGIGSKSNNNCGTVTINGGAITAKGGGYSAGIGGGQNGKAGTITINSGTVTATGYGSAGIGCGYNASGGTITINEGVVVANGGSNSAAIGGAGSSSQRTIININGGDITANAYTYTNSSTNETTVYYGIGAGGSAGSATINLGWTDDAVDRITATNYYGTVNFIDNFVLENTTTVATVDNIDGKTIIPYDGNVYTVDFLEETGSTSLYPQRLYVEWDKVSEPNNPVKDGYKFVEWQLDGVRYDFNSELNSDIILRAHWMEAPDIDYIDENGETQTVPGGSYSFIESTDEALTITDGWYVFMGDVTLSKRVIVNGTVNIILCDGYTVGISKGISVSEGNTLNIYGQQNSTGQLQCTSPNMYCAGIGGANYSTLGTVTVNGGVINATGGARAAGIGGGMYCGGGNITINGGTVNATAGLFAAAIGTGYNCTNSSRNTNIVINGGNISANASYGCAIGSGNSSVFDTIVINGGTIEANAGTGYAAIGGDARSTVDVPITINGGTVTATGGSDAAAVGGSSGKDMKAVVINGGNLTANAGTNGTGIGAATGVTSPTGAVTLNWTAASDSIYASNYNAASITFAKAFKLSSTGTSAYANSSTDNNIADAIIIPDTNITVRFVDSDGITELAPSQTIPNQGTATKPAVTGRYGFNLRWLLNGSEFDFNSALLGDTTLVAQWVAVTPVDYLDENGDAATCTAYYELESDTLNLSDAWYVVSGIMSFNDRLTATGNVSIILKDGAVLGALKGITVNEGATLNIYVQSGRNGIINITAPDSGDTGIGSTSGNNAGTIIINGGVLAVSGGEDAPAIGGGESGTVTINGGEITANGLVGASGSANESGYTINLNWHNLSDSYYSYYFKGNIHLLNDFFYQGTTQLVTENISSNTTLIPATNCIIYIDEVYNKQACTDYTVLEDSTAESVNCANGWYAVTEDTTLTGRINVTGTVNLILCDGATLDVSYIRLATTGSVLNIYSQEGNTGAINAVGQVANMAGIGGGNGTNGTVNIYGGVITAKGGSSAAGIGGGNNGNGGTVHIQRATVNATGGGSAAGIGGGISHCGGNITINSGAVTAKGGAYAAGIGNGYNCGTATSFRFDITINGGTVTASGGSGTLTSGSTTVYIAGAGIGGGGNSSSRATTGTVTINGGNVTANGCKHAESQPKTGLTVVTDSAGIGCGTGGTTSATRPINLYLGWDKATDSVYASTYDVYSITFNDDFILQGTTTPATDSNIDGNTIVPVVFDYDVNEDGYFDIVDVAFVISASVGEIEMTSTQSAKADVNKDTVVDAFDAAFLDRKLMLY